MLHHLWLIKNSYSHMGEVDFYYSPNFATKENILFAQCCR
jgi:hypothetical protein